MIFVEILAFLISVESLIRGIFQGFIFFAWPSSPLSLTSCPLNLEGTTSFK